MADLTRRNVIRQLGAKRIEEVEIGVLSPETVEDKATMRLREWSRKTLMCRVRSTSWNGVEGFDMSRIGFLILLLAAQLFLPASSWAGGWCVLESGKYKVVSHEIKSPKVWIHGKFAGETSWVWIPT